MADTTNWRVQVAQAHVEELQRKALEKEKALAQRAKQREERERELHKQKLERLLNRTIRSVKEEQRDDERELKKEERERKQEERERKQREKELQKERAKEFAKRGECPGDYPPEYWDIKKQVAHMIKVCLMTGGVPRVFVRTREEAYEVEEVLVPTDIDFLMRVINRHKVPRDAWGELVEMHREFADKPRSEKQLLKGIIDVSSPSYSQRLEKEPRALSWDPEEPTTLWFDEELVRRGPTPAWDEFLSRLSQDDEEVFMAYIWSIFHFGDGGRQALWMQGAGSDGKSVVIGVICEFLGNAYASMSAGTHNNQFAYSAMLGKRVVVYGDCQDTGIISYTKIHNVLGGDIVPIERKGEQMFNAKIHARVLIGSNFAPSIHRTANEMSRLLYVEVKRREKMTEDTTWRKRLKKEFWHFLYACRDVYDDLVKDSGRIPQELPGKVFGAAAAKLEVFLEGWEVGEHIEESIPKEQFRKLHNKAVFGESSTVSFNAEREFAHCIREIESRGAKDMGTTIKGIRKIVKVGVGM